MAGYNHKNTDISNYKSSCITENTVLENKT